MKTCTKCKIKQNISSFHHDKKTRDGYSCWCKNCACVKQRNYSLHNKEKIAKYAKQYILDHKEERAEYAFQYRIDNLERLKKYDKIRTRELKEEVIREYGGKCICKHGKKLCGEDTFEFLTIDHKDNKGSEHRKELFGNRATGGKRFYFWLKKNNFPKDNFQLHCMNCNFAKGLYGACPH